MNKISRLIICLLLTSCNNSIEIVPNQVGIILNNTDKVIDTSKVLYFGNHILKSSQEVVIFDISNQSVKFEINTLSKDKKETNIIFTLFFRPIPNKTPILYREYGDTYVKKLIVPNTTKIVKEELSKRNEIELNSKKKLNNLIFDTLKNKGNYNDLIEILDIYTKESNISE